MTENYDVKYILSKGGCTQIRYTVCPADAEPEENIISRADKPHEDFRKLWALLPGVAARFLEFPLQNADGQNIILRVTKVNFLDSTKYGYGMHGSLPYAASDCNTKILLHGNTHPPTGRKENSYAAAVAERKGLDEVAQRRSLQICLLWQTPAANY